MRVYRVLPKVNILNSIVRGVTQIQWRFAEREAAPGRPACTYGLGSAASAGTARQGSAQTGQQEAEDAGLGGHSDCTALLTSLGEDDGNAAIGSEMCPIRLSRLWTSQLRRLTPSVRIPQSKPQAAAQRAARSFSFPVGHLIARSIASVILRIA